MLDKTGGKMVTTDGHRLAYIEQKNLANGSSVDTLIPQKALLELNKLLAGYDGEVGFAVDANHILFELGTRKLVSRLLTGQFPNYEMVIPKDNDKVVQFNRENLNMAIKRVALMSDERSHAIRFYFQPEKLTISTETSDSGQADEVLPIDYKGEEVEIGFNAVYLQDFLDSVDDELVNFDFKSSTSQAELTPVDYQYL